MDDQAFVEEELAPAELAMMLAELVCQSRRRRRFAVVGEEIMMMMMRMRGSGGGSGARGCVSRREGADGRLMANGGRMRGSGVGSWRVKVHLDVSLEGKMEEEGSVANAAHVFPFFVLVAVGRIDGEPHDAAATTGSASASLLLVLLRKRSGDDLGRGCVGQAARGQKLVVTIAGGKTRYRFWRRGGDGVMRRRSLHAGSLRLRRQIVFGTRGNRSGGGVGGRRVHRHLVHVLGVALQRVFGEKSFGAQRASEMLRGVRAN